MFCWPQFAIEDAASQKHKRQKRAEVRHGCWGLAGVADGLWHSLGYACSLSNITVWQHSRVASVWGCHDGCQRMQQFF